MGYWNSIIDIPLVRLSICSGVYKMLDMPFEIWYVICYLVGGSVWYN